MDSVIGSLFLDYSNNRLEQATKDIKACLSRLSNDQLWERHGEHENAVGNLVLHICGNMRQWIVHGIGGAKDVRVRTSEFSADGGWTSEQLTQLLESTVAEAQNVIKDLPTEKLADRITPQEREVSVLGAIYQVVGHVLQHGGQIIVLAKQLTGKDLDLSAPRPR